jgi:predicted ester cyclase
MTWSGGPGTPAEMEGILMTTDDNKAAVSTFLGQLDKSRSAIDEFFVPDCVAHLPGIPVPTDREGFRQFVGMLYTAFPDLHHTVVEQIAEDNDVASIIKVRGTHGGDFQGIPPTGKEVEFEDFMVTRIDGGKVVELWAQFDALMLLGQLGVFQIQA